MLALGAGTFFLLPEKRFKLPAKEVAQQAGISPFLANFVVNTKVGRKIGYLAVKKKIKKFFKEEKKHKRESKDWNNYKFWDEFS